MTKRKLFKNIFKVLRIVFYLSLFISFIIIPTSYFESHSICIFKNLMGIDCPTCGVTRAFSSLMHLKIKDAFMYNQVFTTTIFPISLIVIIDDTINILKYFIIRKETCSLLGHLFKI